jgi:3-oxoacyl-[acyl-carrier protein] reductase
MEDYVAIVTGSATGLGAAIAEGLAALGYRIVLNGAPGLADAEPVKAAIEKKGGQAIVTLGDVGQDAACRAIAAAAVKAFGRIDVLVNNAATTKFAAHDDLDALSDEDFLNIYRVNVVAGFQMIRACRKELAKRHDGAVVNVSSVAGVSGVGSSIAYAASKGALNTMTLSLARALAPDIRVNTICPGFMQSRWFDGRISQDNYRQIVEHMEKTTPLRQAGTPEMVAESAIFFASPKSRHITGEMLMSDAGMHLDLVNMKAR